MTNPRSRSPLGLVLLAAIPGMLGAGAIYWLTFGTSVHELKRTVAAEKRSDAHAARVDQRRAEIVASPKPQVSPLKITTGRGPLTIDRVVADGEDLSVYFHNGSHHHLCYGEVHWKLRAPDGTIIVANSKYLDDASGGLDPGDKGELTDTLKLDDRAASLAVSMTAQPECGGAD